MSTDRGAVAMLCGWEGNRRYGVALAMGHRLRAQWPKEGRQPTLLQRVRHPLLFDGWLGTYFRDF